MRAPGALRELADRLLANRSRTIQLPEKFDDQCPRDWDAAQDAPDVLAIGSRERELEERLALRVAETLREFGAGLSFVALADRMSRS